MSPFRRCNKRSQNSSNQSPLNNLPHDVTANKDNQYCTSAVFMALLQLYCLSILFADLLGAFAKLRQATITSVMYVRPSIYPSAWNNSTPTRRIVMKFNIWEFLQKSVQKIQVSLKPDKNDWYFTWKSFHIYGNISMNYSYNDKCFE